jgi:transcriptional regulator with XRE-family HTH domain
MFAGMSTRVRSTGDAGLYGRRLQAMLGSDLREARLASGVGVRDVARSIGMSKSHVTRVELGLVRDLSIAGTARHAAGLGLKLHARLYPAGGGLRDAAQLDLLRRFRARIGDRWSWQLEAPLNIPGDLRAFDAMLRNGETTIAIEAITRLRDAQAQLRAAALKQRDGQVARLVIVLLGTRHNRAALASAADVLATTFPLGTRATVAALSQGKDPGDNGIVLL